MYKIDVEGKKLIGLEDAQFGDMKLRERYDIQEWIDQNPDILGEDFLIIAKEYILSTGRRLDLLAIDANANLVVVELKRDNSGSDVDMQAIKYASYVSNFTEEDIVRIYAEYQQTDIDSAMKKLQEFIDESEWDNLNQVQRIVLVAGEFHHEVASAVLWLRDNYQVDIKCVRLRAFKHHTGDLFVIPDVIIPLPETKDYTEKRENKQRVTRQANAGRFSMSVGTYTDQELRSRLQATLGYVSPLIPRFRAFLEIISSEKRAFAREEIKRRLFERGIGDDIGQTGRYMSNISQLITKRQNDHLRQLVQFASAGTRGSSKTDFQIADGYLALVREVLMATKPTEVEDTE